MTFLQILGLFVGIPLVLIAVITLAVLASDWRTSAKLANATSTDGPLFVVSGSAAPDPGRLPREIASGAMNEGGGARGSW